MTRASRKRRTWRTRPRDRSRTSGLVATPARLSSCSRSSGHQPPARPSPRRCPVHCRSCPALDSRRVSVARRVAMSCVSYGYHVAVVAQLWLHGGAYLSGEMLTACLHCLGTTLELFQHQGYFRELRPGPQPSLPQPNLSISARRRLGGIQLQRPADALCHA